MTSGFENYKKKLTAKKFKYFFYLNIWSEVLGGFLVDFLSEIFDLTLKNLFVI